MIIDDQNALQAYLVKILASLSEANPDALSKYVLALIKKDKPEHELRKICVEQLDVFLQNETEPFVHKLFDVIKTKGYKYIIKEKKENALQNAYDGIEKKHSSSEDSSEEDSDDTQNLNLNIANKSNNIQQDFVNSKPTFIKEASLDSYVSDSEQLNAQVQSRASKVVARTVAPPTTSTEDEEVEPARRRTESKRVKAESRAGSGSAKTGDKRHRNQHRNSHRRSHDHHRRPKDRSGQQTKTTPAIPSAVVRKRCADYDEKGFCMQGDMCPFDHGNDPVIVRDLNMFRGQGGIGHPPPNINRQTLSKSPLKDASSPQKSQHPIPSISGSHGDHQYNPENPSMIAAASGLGHQGQPPLYPSHIPPPPLNLLPPPPFGAPPPFFPPPLPSLLPHPFAAPPPAQASFRTRELVPLIGGGGGDKHKTYGGRPIMHPGFTSEAGVNVSYHFPDNNHATQSGMGLDFNEASADRNEENDLEDEYEPGGMRAKFDYRRLGAAPPPLHQQQGSELEGGDSIANRLTFGANAKVATTRSIANSIKNKYNGGKGGLRSGKTHNDNRTLELRKIPIEMNTISQINGYFQKFGQLVNIQVNHANDPQSALITFSSNQEAYRAYKCQDPVFNNRFVKIFWHRTSAEVNDKDVNLNELLQDSEGKEEYTPLKPEFKPSGLESGGGAEDSEKMREANGDQYHPSYVPQQGGIKGHKTVHPKTAFNDPSKFRINHKLDGSKANNTADPSSNNNAGVAPTSDASNGTDQAINTLGQPGLVVAKEKRRKDAMELQQSLEKQRYELLLKQIQNQKMLITKMEQNPALFSTKEKEVMLQNLKSLMATITKLKAEIDAKRKMVQTTDAGKKLADLDVIKTKKELLDVELELMTRQAAAVPENSEDTIANSNNNNESAELEMRVAVLKAKARSMGLLPPRVENSYFDEDPIASNRSVGAPSKKRPKWYNVPNYYYPSSYLDRRPKNVLVKGITDSENRSQLALLITQMYGIKVQEIAVSDDPTPALELQFGSRKEAEKVMAVGITLDNEPVKMIWGPPSQAPNSMASTFKRQSVETTDLQNSEYSIDYTLSVPAHIVDELDENAIRKVAIGVRPAPPNEIEDIDEDDADGETETRSWRP